MLAEHIQSIMQCCIQDYSLFLPDLSLRTTASTCSSSAVSLLQGLLNTVIVLPIFHLQGEIKDEKDKVTYYSLLRVLLTKLARLSDSQLHQFASSHCHELLSLSMTTTRGFKDISGTPKELRSSLMGDVFSIAAGLARCAIAEAV